MSHVTCHVSHVPCHVSHLTFFLHWLSLLVEGLLSTGPTLSSFPFDRCYMILPCYLHSIDICCFIYRLCRWYCWRIQIWRKILQVWRKIFFKIELHGVHGIRFFLACWLWLLALVTYDTGHVTPPTSEKIKLINKNLKGTLPPKKVHPPPNNKKKIKKKYGPLSLGK